MARSHRVPYNHAHPFKDGWVPSRLDMGADGTFTHRVYAPVGGRIEYAGVFNGWDGSHGLILHAGHDLGEAVPTNRLYFVEGLLPVVHTDHLVAPGDPIAVASRNPYNGVVGNIEWGVAAPGPRGLQTNAYASTLGVGSTEARDMVLRFADWFENVLGVAAPTSTSGAGRP